jgi:hypothetical protein
VVDAADAHERGHDDSGDVPVCTGEAMVDVGAHTRHAIAAHVHAAHIHDEGCGRGCFES